MVTYTSNKYIAKPANGEYPDTWDIPVNSDFDIIDKALGSYVAKTLSSGDTTLTLSEAQNQQISLSGTLSGDARIIIPFQSGSTTLAVGGQWIVYNNTTGAHSVSIITQVTASTGVTIPQGYRCTIMSDQTNVHFADDTRVQFDTTGLTVTAGSPPTVGLTIPVTAVNGGTSQTAYAAGDILYASATNTLSKLPAGTNGYILTMGASLPSWQAPTAPPAPGITSLTLSGGTTGLLVNGSASATLTANGTFTISGTLGVPFGGTGATSLSGYLKGNGTSAFTAVSTIPGSDISGAVASATSATTATSATSATTATNVSGSGTVSTTTVTATGDITTSSSSRVIVGSGSGGAVISYSGGNAYLNSQSGYYLFSGSVSTGGAVAGTVNWLCTSTAFFLASGITSANCYFGTAWTNVSDERTKKNVENYSIGLAAINQLRPVSFQYNGVNNTPDDGRTRVSFIAQEVANTSLSSMVSSDEHGYMNVNTNDLIFALVNAVKELSARVVALEAKVP